MTTDGEGVSPKLRAIAEAATPGPWHYLGPTSGRRDGEGELHPCVLGRNYENPVCVMEGDYDSEQADAAHIAAWSPDRALAALAVIEAAQRRERWNQICSQSVQEGGGIDNRGYKRAVKAWAQAEDDERQALARWEALP